MPRSAESFQATVLQELLRKHGLKHLRVRRHGSTLAVESGPDNAPFKHFRLSRDTVHLWRLDMAGQAQRWERTPFRDTLERLVTLVIETFPWTLTDVTRNPERTSDRRH
jgi:hypothetical protein